ncbi:hypothetical protein [Flavobacterium sp. SM2513]|uniref:hypothetical protein n=1 Tax=Flavobacterium sp. SM2513 TaxID=3424766 RepID=UPI003D7F3C0B
MSIFLIILFLLIVVLLIKNIRFRSFYLVLFLPTLFWVVGSGTYSGEKSTMNISIFFVTIFGVISDVVNFRIYNIDFLVEFYSLLFAVFDDDYN